MLTRFRAVTVSRRGRQAFLRGVSVGIFIVLGAPGLSRAPTTVQPAGNGWIINTPGQPPTTVHPFGNDSIVNSPGKSPIVCTPVGNGVICR